MNFAIVIPSRDAAPALAETLRSVLAQAGDFNLACHVQDGCSADASLDLLQAQLLQVRHACQPVQCRRLTFSYASAPDAGMFEAINTGFARLLAEEVDYMLWLEAGDRLTPRALADLARYCRLHPEDDWLVGVSLEGDASSRSDQPPPRFRRQDLAAGHHDGRLLGRVPRGATLWRKSLWDRCGPLDTSLLYAADYEYWMRAAARGFTLKSVRLPLLWRRKRAETSPSDAFYKDEVNLVRLRNN